MIPIWSDLSSPIYCIQEDHGNPDILFIGPEWSVWVTIYGGMKWVQLKKEIPPIQIKNLTIQRAYEETSGVFMRKGLDGVYD